MISVQCVLLFPRFAYLAAEGFFLYLIAVIIQAMRYLCLDYGLKRIGVAVSDEEGRMAFPMGIIFHRGIDAVIKEIVERIKKEHIGSVVVGLPVGLDSKETQQTTITRRFVTALKKAVSIPVEIENEMLTSRMAADSGMKGGHRDAASAAIILQSYLDKSNR